MNLSTRSFICCKSHPRDAFISSAFPSAITIPSSDISPNTKCISDAGSLLLAQGTWSSVSLQTVDLSTTPPTVHPSERSLSVTNPAVLAFGSTGCDSEKICHPVGEKQQLFLIYEFNSFIYGENYASKQLKIMTWLLNIFNLYILCNESCFS